MVETALYFPYMRVPQTSWFTQVLLYWDAGAAIVPAGLQRDEAALGWYMSELVRAGLVELVRPEEALSRHHGAFDERVLTLLDAHEPAVRGHPRRWARVHTDKLGWSLFQTMADKGLAPA